MGEVTVFPKVSRKEKEWPMRYEGVCGCWLRKILP